MRGGIKDCGVGKKKKALEKPIRELWNSTLKEINAERVSEDKRFPVFLSVPDIDDWFDWFVYAVDNVLEESSRAVILSGATRLFMDIPPECPNEPEARFIEHLSDPFGNAITYDDVFEFAQRNVMKYWEKLCKAIIDKEPKVFDLPNGDLDTGRLLNRNDSVSVVNDVPYVIW